MVGVAGMTAVAVAEGVMVLNLSSVSYRLPQLTLTAKKKKKYEISSLS